LHLCFQKVLKNCIDKDWDDDLVLAKKMMEILLYCGELDGVARGFHQTLVSCLSSMEEAISEAQLPTLSDSMTTEKGHGFIETELLLVPAPGDNNAHASAAAIFKLVAWPFGGDNIRPHTEDVKVHDTIVNHEEVSLGVHTEWVAEITARYGIDTGGSPSGISSSMLARGSGAFIGSENPSGWAASRSSRDYEEGASTLELLPSLP
jgi:hypothetical protein